MIGKLPTSRDAGLVRPRKLHQRPSIDHVGNWVRVATEFPKVEYYVSCSAHESAIINSELPLMFKKT